MSGEPNQLSPEHHLWPIIDEVAEASARVESPPETYWESRPENQPHSPTCPRRLSARQIIRQRRSAVALDGRTGLCQETFYGMLERVLAMPGRVPWGSLPWKPAIHLVLFVHRVDGLDPGLYSLVREPGALDDLKAATRSEFEWSRPAGCPDDRNYNRV